MEQKSSTDIRRSFKYSFLEGMFGAPIATISSGALLTGYALYLGASPFEISIILSLPFLTQLVQPLSPRIIDAVGDLRKLTAYGILFSRLIWALIGFLPILFLFNVKPVGLFIVLVGASLILFNISQNSWLLWMSDLIPRKMRGRFFGRRNMYIGLITMALLLGTGYFLDLFAAHGETGLGYSILILAGVGLGYLSFRFILRVKDVPVKSGERISPSRLLAEIKNNERFRSILIFIGIWTFVTGIASPFYYVYLFQTLRWSYGDATIYAAIATGLPFLMQPFWGKILDRVGHKPLLHICVSSVTIVPLIWILITPPISKYLWIEAVVSGMLWAGINITVFDIVLYALPGERKAPVVAAFSSITGVINFTAMLVGGIIVSLLGSLHFHVATWEFSVYHVPFFLSFAGRIVAARFIKNIQEPEAKSVSVVAQVITSGLIKRVSLGRQFWIFFTRINGKKNHQKKDQPLTTLASPDTDETTNPTDFFE